MTPDPLRAHLARVLDWGEAHVTFDKAIDGIPRDKRGGVAAGFEHTPWQLLEHMRIAQKDILEFSTDAKYVAPKWPEEYWPKSKTPPNDKAWAKSVRAFNSDLEAMRKLVAAESTDLYAPIPHGDGQTILREALLIADHNAYHIGELVLVRRLLGAWK